MIKNASPTAVKRLHRTVGEISTHGNCHGTHGLIAELCVGLLLVFHPALGVRQSLEPCTEQIHNYRHIMGDSFSAHGS